MKQGKANRARHEQMKGHYKKFYRGTQCYYCGDMASVIDHVPAIAVAYSYGRDYFDQKNIPLITVSACRECNGILGSRPINTLNKRVKFVYETLIKRYERYLRMVDWPEDELNELNGWLKDYVQTQSNFKQFMERRFMYMEDLHEDIV